MSLRQWRSTASSMSLTFQNQYPATSSFASAKDPSMTLRRGPSKAIRLPAEEGLRPSQSPGFMIPALTSSSLNLSIASIDVIISGVGVKPISLSSVALTNTITRMIDLLVEPA